MHFHLAMATAKLTLVESQAWDLMHGAMTTKYDVVRSAWGPDNATTGLCDWAV